jgi:hypothetical protein
LSVVGRSCIQENYGERTGSAGQDRDHGRDEAGEPDYGNEDENALHRTAGQQAAGSAKESPASKEGTMRRGSILGRVEDRRKTGRDY